MRNILQKTLLLGLLGSNGLSLADKPAYIIFEGNQLAQGRAVWLDTCENCHAYGVADSPNPLKPKDWITRLQKQQTTLYQNAINGYFGPDDSYMPPRGGNDALSDEEIKAAVDYMTSLARFYIDQEEHKP